MEKIVITEKNVKDMKDPELKEKHRLRCKAYNDKMKAMREYCKAQNVEL